MLKAQKKRGFVEHNQSHGERKALTQWQITFLVKKTNDLCLRSWP